MTSYQNIKTLSAAEQAVGRGKRYMGGGYDMSRLAKGCMCIAVAIICVMYAAIPHANKEVGFDEQTDIISPLYILDDFEEGSD